jgi:excisionase family DNA binding protein
MPEEDDVDEREPRLARLSVAGQMLGISESAVRRLIRQGELPAVKIFADLRVPVSEIDALIARKLGEGEIEAASLRPADEVQ